MRKRSGDVEDVRGFLRREHLAHRHERHCIPVADWPEDLQQQPREAWEEYYFGIRTVIEQKLEPLLSPLFDTSGQDATKLACSVLIDARRQWATHRLAYWGGHYWFPLAPFTCVNMCQPSTKRNIRNNRNVRGYAATSGWTPCWRRGSCGRPRRRGTAGRRSAGPS